MRSDQNRIIHCCRSLDTQSLDISFNVTLDAVSEIRELGSLGFFVYGAAFTVLALCPVPLMPPYDDRRLLDGYRVSDSSIFTRLPLPPLFWDIGSVKFFWFDI